MKILHFLMAGLRPAISIVAPRFAFPLLLLTAGLLFVQPSAGQSGTWMATGSLTTAHANHTATLLPNGKVLVAGGGPYLVLTSAELYDPATGTWTATSSMASGRFFHAATLLPTGVLLVAVGDAAGDDDTGSRAGVEGSA